MGDVGRVGQDGRGHVYVASILNRKDEDESELGRVFDISPEGAPRLVAADFVPTGRLVSDASAP